MKNTFGNHITLTLFGESHGEAIGAVLDGLAPGIRIDNEYIAKRLSLRRPSGKISTARVEADEYKIVSGVFNGYTTGTPLTIIIPNTNTQSKAYTPELPRPGHADYTAECKYHGFQDYRGGGHFSGRLTAPIVAAGAILSLALMQKGIYIGTHIASLHSECDRGFGDDILSDINALSEMIFPVLDRDAADRMREIAEEAAAEGDSVGGVLETAVVGCPAGVGEPWFDTVEGMLSHALFSIPAIKGVEFGDGFGFAALKGSEANDPFRYVDGRVVTETNRNGGINGGITNGMPITFRCAVKPTPSIYKSQNSVNIRTAENSTLEIKGRHDPAIIHRARIVVDSITALVIADMLATKYGTDWLAVK